MKDMELVAETLYEDEVRSIEKKKKRKIQKLTEISGSVFHNDFMCEVVCFPISSHIFIS